MVLCDYTGTICYTCQLMTISFQELLQLFAFIIKYVYLALCVSPKIENSLLRREKLPVLETFHLIDIGPDVYLILG